MALKRVAIPSPNYSSRGGSAVRLCVLHTAEGATTYQSLGSYFGSTSSQVSSHTGIDDTANTVGEYVQRSGKAWTAANANPYSIQTELCAFAKWSTSEWNQHPTMLQNCAKWIAEECAYFDIPITKLSASQAQDGHSKGVCQHNDLGAAGGGHWDCGGGFPMGDVLDMARGEKPSGGGGNGGGSSGGGSSSGGGTTTKAPAFPFPSSDYLGVPDGSKHWHDGHGGGADSVQVKKWQQQMSARGWSISVDGQYGSGSASICRQFQQEKGLGVDGKVGPQTWAASWNAPTT